MDIFNLIKALVGKQGISYFVNLKPGDEWPTTVSKSE